MRSTNEPDVMDLAGARSGLGQLHSRFDAIENDIGTNMGHADTSADLRCGQVCLGTQFLVGRLSVFLQSIQQLDIEAVQQ